MSVPVRHVVELRPPRKGERYVNFGALGTASWDYHGESSRWVVVEASDSAPGIRQSDENAPPAPDVPRNRPEGTQRPPWERSTWFHEDGTLKAWSPWRPPRGVPYKTYFGVPLDPPATSEQGAHP